MGGEVIKEFLVGLGFSVDDAELSKFNKSIAEAATKVVGLYAAINLTAGAVVAGISSMSESFEDLGYSMRIIAPAINKALFLKQEMLKAYAAAGINIRQTVVDSIKLNMSLAKTKFALEAIYKSVGSKFFTLITKQSDLFRKSLYANLPKIKKALEGFVTFVLKAFEAVTILGARVWQILGQVYNFFKKLDDATNGWSTVIFGVIAAWNLLNLSFLATPLGMLITGIAALLLLWDDFKTFKEGGKSLIDWGSETTKSMLGVVAVVGAVALAFKAWGVISTVIDLMKAFNGVLTVTDALLAVAELPFWAIATAVLAVVAALSLADSKWKIFGGHLSGFFSGIGSKIMDFAGGPTVVAGGQNTAANIAANVQNNPASKPVTNPISSNVANNNNAKTANVHFQNNVTVQGAADVNSVGKSQGDHAQRTAQQVGALAGQALQ